jgi:hypothetical protein
MWMSKRQMGRLGTQRSYYLYGVRLKSVVPLPGRELGGSGKVGIELFNGSASLFSRARHEAGVRPEKEDWFAHARLSDGSDYLEWSGLFEFLVSSDGRRIACRELNDASPESFQTYLVGQVLSFALLKQGIEPLHATTVVIEGEAVAFLGDCSYGKSSLGAAFLQVGYRLLTDDLLVLKERKDRFLAYPGPPRIKLFPDIAKRLFGDRVNGTPMNNQTSKVVIPLDQNEVVSPQVAVPLRAIYVLTPPVSSRSQRITTRPLPPRRSFVELIRNSFNTVIVEPHRLGRQFDLAARLAARVPVRSLTYPRDLGRISQVRKSIVRELAAW